MFTIGASNGDPQNAIGLNHTGNGIPTHLSMHHHGNVHSHSGMTQASHLHTGHHHPGHGLINIGSAGALADIHGLDLESIGKLNSGNNNNNNNGMTGNIENSLQSNTKIRFKQLIKEGITKHTNFSIQTVLEARIARHQNKNVIEPDFLQHSWQT